MISSKHKEFYVAEGFVEDVTALLKEFIEKETVEFSAFAEIWRKHNFSLIFMGRPEKIETSEFTNEIFRISAHFLTSSSFYERISSVYVLYALYRNQVADPPIKIRITLPQWEIINNLHIEARDKKYRTLHYVIDYLIKNAFLFVANSTLKGPLIGFIRPLPPTIADSSFQENYESDIKEYCVKDRIKELMDLKEMYRESKMDIDPNICVSRDDESEVYENFISQLDNIADKSQEPRQGNKDNVGTRRARIKADAFTKEVMDRYGRSLAGGSSKACEEDQNSNDKAGVKEKVSFRRKRVPKHERRVGRPPKNPVIVVPEAEKSDDEDLDISYLIEQQKDLYLPPEEVDSKKLRYRPGKQYYKISPTKVGSDSSD